MNVARWQQIKSVVGDALECDDTQARDEFLSQACAQDTALRREVESMLAHASDRLDVCADNLAHARAGDGSLLIGQRLGDYELIRELGRGGMGAIYLARRADEEFEKEVAIKVLKRGTDTDEVLRRFRAERQILARLEHPNIARLLDAGTTADGLPYFVMEYVAGARITDFCVARKLSIGDRVRLFLKVCDAVRFAHQNLVVHRDLKPGNILVNAEGEPKLLDFGIAKLLAPEIATLEVTALQSQRLTPAYASPEQVRGDLVTTVTDVYGLGALLYELLTGTPPHRFSSAHPSPTELLRVVAEAKAPRASSVAANAEMRHHLRGDLDTILETALRKRPQERYSGVGFFADDLRRYLNGRPVRARPATFGYRAGKFIGRNKIAVGAAVILVLALLGGGIVTVWQARRAAWHAERAAHHFRDLRQLANSFLFEFHDAIATLPGATAARQLVVGRALQYLDGLARDTSDDPQLQIELAQAYVKVGDVQGKPYTPNLGDAPGAVRSYQKAIQIAEPLARREHGSAITSARRTVMTACANLAGVQSRMSDLDSATRNNSRALEIAERLVNEDSTHTKEWREMIVGCEVGLGDAIEAGNHRREDPVLFRNALEHYRRALAIAEELLAATPNSVLELRRLARCCTRVAAVLAELGAQTGEAATFDECFALHNRTLELHEVALKLEPENATIRRNIADELVMTAYAHALARRDLDEAIAKCARALEIEKPLAAADPSNAEAQQDLSFAHYVNGRLFQAKGDPATAEQHYAAALEILEPLVRAHPGNVETSFDLERVRRGLAEVKAFQNGGRG